MAHLKTSFLHGKGVQCGTQDLGSGIWDAGCRVLDVGRGMHDSGCGHGGAKGWGERCPAVGLLGSSKAGQCQRAGPPFPTGCWCLSCLLKNTARLQCPKTAEGMRLARAY